MSIFLLILILLAGFVAGIANVIAGAGSLITFPILVAVGLPPVTANMTNDIGLTTGNISGVFAVRGNLRHSGKNFVRLMLIAAVGSVLGAFLLILLPSHIFEWIAPIMLLIASLLTLAKSWVMAHNGWLTKLPAAYETTIFVIATYGGYFGSGIGLLFMAALSIFEAGNIKRLNAYKNVFQLLSNGIAGLIFIFVARKINWPAALALSVGALLGAQIGAKISQHISEKMLRWVISSLGILAALVLFLENFVKF